MYRIIQKEKGWQFMIIITTNFRRILKKPINIIVMLVLPIVLNLIIITLANNPTKYNVVLVTKEETFLTEIVKETFEKEFSLKIADSETEAKQSILDGYADYLVVIPDDFTEKIMLGEASIMTYSREDDESLKPISVYVSTYFSAINKMGKEANHDEKLLNDNLEKYTNGVVSVDYQYYSEVSTASVDNAVNSLGYVAVGMVYFIVFSTMLLFEDKKCGVADRLYSTPISRMSYYFQHLISYMCLAAVQITIMILVIPRIVDVNYGADLPQALMLFMVCLLFAAACISMGIAISMFSKNTIMVNSLVSMINVPMLMLGGCFWPSSIMPESVQKVARIMPTTWFLKSARGVLLKENVETYILWIILLCGFTLLLLILTSLATANLSGQFKILEVNKEGKE